mmetsp:Transcript_38343/g.95372  ORF Transcript_38343/g.95372 Transcript_38343/m.95372 type:complete len:257 (-) Transcript_38343:955-1725(-)
MPLVPRGRHLLKDLLVLFLLVAHVVRLNVQIVSRRELIEKEGDHFLHPFKLVEVLVLLDRCVEARLSRCLQPDDDTFALRDGCLRYLDGSGHLHRHAHLAEKALVAPPIMRHHPTGRVVSRRANLKCTDGEVHAVVQLRPEHGRIIVDALLLCRQVNDVCIELCSLEAQLPREVHASALHVKSDKLHRAVPTALHARPERREIGERSACAPHAEPLHVCHVGKRRGARRGTVDDARLRAQLLQLAYRFSGLRRSLL